MTDSRHVVAVIGGATAGAEVAARLSERGAEVVVFEQNPRPYGKIEDGLPRWHLGLRHKEFKSINEKLSLPRVHFVPNTKLGRDVNLTELVEKWGFSAVVFANGAWHDRPLPLKDASKYVGKGLIYQNQYVVWFNHLFDPDYKGGRYTIGEGIAVVGGGLASIDVMKLLMLGRTLELLHARGIKPHLEEYEQTGIPEWLKEHGLSLAELNVKPSTLYYRRRLEDMPLAEIPHDATPEKRAKVEGARKKIVDKATDKYCFRVEPLCAPDSFIVENDRVAGLNLRRQRYENGKVIPTDEVFEHRCAFVVSSIGSVPEPLDGVEMDGELFKFVDRETGRLGKWSHVFSTGNVVTGKGNIVSSRRHAVSLSAHVAEQFLGLAPGDVEVPHNAGEATAAKVSGFLGHQAPLTGNVVDSLLKRCKEQQAKVGYKGTYDDWLKAHPLPPEDG